VTREVRMSETALWSDYVLPDTPTLERLEVTVKEEHAFLLEPAIPAQGEAKSGPDFWREFGKRLGMGDTFDKTAEDWIALRLQTQDPAIAALNPPLTMERLKKEKIVRLNLPQEPYNVWANLDFPTPSGRMEVYTEGLAKVNQAVPQYLVPVIRGPRAQKYPFHLFVGRHRFFVQSQFSEFDDLRKLAGDKPFIRMNAQDAIGHGFVAGDKIEVFNDGGSFRVPVELSAAIPRGIVFAYLAYSSKEWEGDPPQALMSPSGTPEVMDDVMRATADYFKPMMGFPETLDIDHHLLGGWETIFDNVCDVRKA
jgi:anaerobic selenocysteine-containing dehydrogenase